MGGERSAPLEGPLAMRTLMVLDLRVGGHVGLQVMLARKRPRTDIAHVLLRGLIQEESP